MVRHNAVPLFPGVGPYPDRLPSSAAPAATAPPILDQLPDRGLLVQDSNPNKIRPVTRSTTVAPPKLGRGRCFNPCSDLRICPTTGGRVLPSAPWFPWDLLEDDLRRLEAPLVDLVVTVANAAQLPPELIDDLSRPSVPIA